MQGLHARTHTRTHPHTSHTPGAGLIRSCSFDLPAALLRHHIHNGGATVEPQPGKRQQPLVATELAASMCVLSQGWRVREIKPRARFVPSTLKTTVVCVQLTGRDQHGHGDIQPLCCGKSPSATGVNVENGGGRGSLYILVGDTLYPAETAFVEDLTQHNRPHLTPPPPCDMSRQLPVCWPR